MSNERVIKFRVWHPVFGMMKPWTLKEKTEWTEKKGERVIDVHWDDGVIFMQFTGLHDKNGVEIYEGDVVVHDGENCIINFKAGSFGIDFQETVRKPYDRILSSTQWEVIGNIYQNPELLNP